MSGHIANAPLPICCRSLRRWVGVSTSMHMARPKDKQDESSTGKEFSSVNRASHLAKSAWSSGEGDVYGSCPAGSPAVLAGPYGEAKNTVNNVRGGSLLQGNF